MINTFLIKYLVEIFFSLTLIQFIILINLNFKKIENQLLYYVNFILFKFFFFYSIYSNNLFFFIQFLILKFKKFNKNIQNVS